jgi:hypothetical protein
MSEKFSSRNSAPVGKSLMSLLNEDEPEIDVGDNYSRSAANYNAQSQSNISSARNPDHNDIPYNPDITISSPNMKNSSPYHNYLMPRDSNLKDSSNMGNSSPLYSDSSTNYNRSPSPSGNSDLLSANSPYSGRPGRKIADSGSNSPMSTSSNPGRFEPRTRGLSNEDKRQRRLIRNRLAAQESRRKKKNYISDLEQKVRSLEADNTRLQHEVNSLTGKLDPNSVPNSPGNLPHGASSSGLNTSQRSGTYAQDDPDRMSVSPPYQPQPPRQ